MSVSESIYINKHDCVKDRHTHIQREREIEIEIEKERETEKKRKKKREKARTLPLQHRSLPQETPSRVRYKYDISTI